MILRQTLAEPVNGYWDGGKKQVFDWKIDWFHGGKDSKGTFVRVGSWAANHWFNVAQGKTEKQTLANARRRLSRSTRVKSTFEYIERG
jgi:hypothetical protein